MAPLNWKLRLSLGHFGLLLPLSQQAKSVMGLAGMIHADDKEKLDFSIMEVRKSIFGAQEIA